LSPPLCKILFGLFNALSEPQVCMTCPSFLPLFGGVVSEGLAGFQITAQGGLPARGTAPSGWGDGRRDQLAEGRRQPDQPAVSTMITTPAVTAVAAASRIKTERSIARPIATVCASMAATIRSPGWDVGCEGVMRRPFRSEARLHPMRGIFDGRYRTRCISNCATAAAWCRAAGNDRHHLGLMISARARDPGKRSTRSAEWIVERV